MTFQTPIHAAAAVEVRREAGFPEAIDRIDGHARHAFLRRPWFAGAGSADATTLTVTRADGAVVAALPTIAGKLGLRAVPGCYWPFRSFPVAADATDEELAALLVAQRKLGRAWRLGPIMDDDPTLLRLLALARGCGYSVLARRTATSHALDIGAEWPKPSTLRNLRKHEKRLAKIGALDFRFAPGSAWTAETLDLLADIERKSWVGSRADADSKFLDPAMRRGWEEMLADPAMAEMLSVGVLSIAGAPVAFSFGLDCGAVRYCIATSYDADFARHSPGYLTGYWTYMAAAERGVTRLSLGAGDGGEKSSMGAEPEAELMDYLFVRGAWVSALLLPFCVRP